MEILTVFEAVNSMAHYTDYIAEYLRTYSAHRRNPPNVQVRPYPLEGFSIAQYALSV